ncbi:MAG: FAD:protein FMN transferase [Actinobacteria bacterium]|nr:FAD:protein FMN transferase [Actinomycetota bacterium]MBU1944062.1 FAD:protein FMN transferase [Actinomycetota bacterium]MBU2687535.1 FAD:protein FMN transferase [Actinomycetota bacterium]
MIAVTCGAVVLIVYLTNRQNTGSPEGTYKSATLFAMDTTLDVTIQGRSDREARADAEAVRRTVKGVEDYTSLFIDTSDVAAVNGNAGVAPVKVRPETLLMIKRSLDYSQRSDGAFDITVGPLAELWGFYSGEFRVPSRAQIEAVLPLVGWRRVAIDEPNGTVMLAEKGMAIDLGGVAKGYALGVAAEELRSRGVEHGLINFGGAVAAIGDRSDGRKWVVGIKNPRGEAGDIVGELAVEDTFVNTSGDYQRYFVENGVRYCHIFDPRTGYPARDMMAVTVVGPDPMNNDIICKPLFVLGQEWGMGFMRAEPAYEALFIDADGEIGMTPGMEKKYVITMQGSVR